MSKLAAAALTALFFLLIGSQSLAQKTSMMGHNRADNSAMNGSDSIGAHGHKVTHELKAKPGKFKKVRKSEIRLRSVEPLRELPQFQGNILSPTQNSQKGIGIEFGLGN